MITNNRYLHMIRTLIIALALTIGLALASSGSAFAATILNSDTSVAGEGCIMLGFEGSYLAQDQAALARINEIRREACEVGNVPDPRNPARMLTEADYVPLRWSSDLERSARIRAAEGTITWSHTRTNGSNYDRMTVSCSINAENITGNSGEDMLAGIDKWYAEKDAWVNQTEDARTENYEHIINPKFRHVGVGMFDSDQGSLNTLCAHFTVVNGLDESMADGMSGIIQKVEVSESLILELVQSGETSMSNEKTLQLVPRYRMASPEAGEVSEHLMPLGTLTYTAKNPEIATISSDGVITGVGLGDAAFDVKENGNTIGSITIKVECNHKYEVSEPDADGKVSGECSKCGDTFGKEVVPTSYRIALGNSKVKEGQLFYDITPNPNPTGSYVKMTFYDNQTGIEKDKLEYSTMVIESSDESVIKSTSTRYSRSMRVLKAGVTRLTVYPKYNPDPALTRTFTIWAGNDGDLSLEDCEITGLQDVYVHNSAGFQPTSNDFKVTYNGITVPQIIFIMTEASERMNVGPVTFTISGRGLFGGTVTREYLLVHSMTYHEAVESTCDKAGTVEYWRCSGCNKNYSEEEGINRLASVEMPMKPHTYNGFSTNHDATCTHDGTKEGICTVCGHSETVIDVGSKLPHSAVDAPEVKPTCTEPGTTAGEKCEKCGAIVSGVETIQPLGHEYGAWKTVTRATALKAGSKKRTCNSCGDSETATISKLTPKIKLSATSKTIKKKKSYTLKISGLAYGDGVKSVVISKKVATIKKVRTNQYKITGTKKGTAYVTVKLKSGKTAKCKVTIK